MKGNILCLLVVLFCLSLCRSSQIAADLRARIADIETGLQVPIMLDVLLLSATNTIEPAHLSSLLTDLQSTYSPTLLDTKQALRVNYSLTYTVKSLASAAHEYERLLQQHLVKVHTADPLRQAEHVINTEHVTKYFDQLGGIYSRDPLRAEVRLAVVLDSRAVLTRHQAQVYTVFVVHIDKRNIAADPALQYRYQQAGQGPECAVFVGPGRWLVVDLSAGPTRAFGPLDTSVGTVGGHSLPSLLLDAESMADHVASLCLSALKHVFIPDLEYLVMRDNNKVIIPLIIFRDHNEFDSWEDITRGIDLSQLRRQVSKMFLPGQDVQLFPALHSLHAHKHVSVALHKSFRTLNEYHPDQRGLFKVTTRTYLDGVSLLHALKSVPDLLAEGLLADVLDLKQLIPDLKLSGKSEGVNRGVRVLPVYIFSLKNSEPNLLLDNGDLYEATSDGVVVLQTLQRNISVPFFSDDHVVTLDGLNTIKNIIAGLSIALGGITEPVRHYSRVRGAFVEDYLWAIGYHPYGPFAHSDHLSDIFADAVIRNHITSKLHSAIETVSVLMHEVDVFAKVYLSIDDRKLVTWEDLIAREGNKRIEDFSSVLLTHLNMITKQLRLCAERLQHYDLSFAAPAADAAHQTSLLALTSIRQTLSDLSIVIECHSHRTPNLSRGLPYLELARGLFFALIVFVVVKLLAGRRKLRAVDVEFKRKKDQ